VETGRHVENGAVWTHRPNEPGLLT
jgi:hypothetical protein